MHSYISSNNSYGIISYLVGKLDSSPIFKVDTISKPVDPIKMYTNDIYLDYDVASGEQPTLEIDFRSLSISITGYLIKFVVNTTPPVQWQLLGRNALYEQWTIVDDPGLNTDVCPQSDYNARCSVNNSLKWNFSKPCGPFRYIKFINILQRENKQTGKPKGYMRLGKIDFYGSIWVNSR